MFSVHAILLRSSLDLGLCGIQKNPVSVFFSNLKIMGKNQCVACSVVILVLSIVMDVHGLLDVICLIRL